MQELHNREQHRGWGSAISRQGAELGQAQTIFRFIIFLKKEVRNTYTIEKSFMSTADPPYSSEQEKETAKDM